MRAKDYYKNEIIKKINEVDDETFLRRLDKLINVILKIDNDWVLQQFERFINNIQK